MILLLGATSYIGQAFARELRARGETFIPLSRNTLDYTRFEFLFGYIRRIKPDFLINAEGVWGSSDAGSAEDVRACIFETNTLLPQTIGRACMMTNTAWGHVSCTSIYNGAKVFENGKLRTATDLNSPRMRRLYAQHPENFLGFNEADKPNFSFRSPPCSYTAGTKALAEEWLGERDGTYIWRVGTPFGEVDGRPNLLSRLQSYAKIFDQFTTVCYLNDFVSGCLHLIERHAPYGVYNLSNPGAITTREIVQLIQQILKPGRRFEFWNGETEFHLNTTASPRSSCILDSGKLARTGIKPRPAHAAIEAALHQWRPAERAVGRGMSVEVESMRRWEADAMVGKAWEDYFTKGGMDRRAV